MSREEDITKLLTTCPKILDTLESNIDSGAWCEHTEIQEFIEALIALNVIPGPIEDYFD